VKAVVCKALGPVTNLIVDEMPEPQPQRGEVLVDVRAAGVNFPDVLMVAGAYQVQVPAPFVPGHEVAGTVVAVGPDVTDFEVGQRVAGNVPWGAFAERVIVRADALIPVPDSIELREAAAMLLAYATSHYALQDRAELKRHETLVVLGAAGGVGIAAVQIGKAIGARVIAAASTDDKLAFCRENGADEVINYSTDDLKQRIRDLTDGQGADVVYDPVGGELTEAAVRATAWNGRVLVVGFASGEIPRVPLNLVLLKGCQLVGVFWGSFVARSPDRHRANVRQLFEWLEQGRLRVHIDGVYPFERASEALQCLADRRVRGKVVLEPGP
jgi:NADPH2:quinone reductase